MTAPPGAAGPPPADVAVPAGTRLVADAGLRCLDGGRTLLGGSPLRLLRLSEAGAAVAAGWLAGEPVGAAPAAARLARRLVRAGVAHPRPVVAPQAPPDAVTVVIPVRDDAGGLAATLASLTAEPAAAPRAVVVVDDGSVDAAALAVLAERTGATLLRRPRPGGPAAARNAGLSTVATPFVAFLDAGVDARPGWLAPLLGALDDPAVAAVAPRVRSVAGPTLLERFERTRSPLDLGSAPAQVAPGTRVSYVPTATLVARTGALVGVGGFDERLRFGEDVDLVWRLVSAGWSVRYEPAAEVEHRPRATWRGWLRQRAGYGSAAAPLARRHPGAVAPVQVSAWSALAWALLVARRPVPALAVAAGTTALLPRKLGALEHPWPEAVRLAASGHLGAGRLLGGALTRTWWPLTLVAALARPAARRAALAAAVVPPLLEWRAQPPDERIDPVRHVALRLADDIAYGTGVWQGAWRERSPAALVPELRSWPGRRAGAARA